MIFVGGEVKRSTSSADVAVVDEGVADVDVAISSALASCKGCQFNASIVLLEDSSGIPFPLLLVPPGLITALLAAIFLDIIVRVLGNFR